MCLHAGVSTHIHTHLPPGPAALRALPGSALMRNSSRKGSLEADIGPGGGPGCPRHARGAGGRRRKKLEEVEVGKAKQSPFPLKEVPLSPGKLWKRVFSPPPFPLRALLALTATVWEGCMGFCFPPPPAAPRPPVTLPENEVYFVHSHYSPFSKLDSCR